MPAAECSASSAAAKPYESRQLRNTTNDSDRRGKYLEKFGLTCQMCKDAAIQNY